MSRLVVRAAGGVVWRSVGTGRTGVGDTSGGSDAPVEVVVVHRPPPHDDWSLPKGKLEHGERHRDAAVREVHEETGLRCRIDDRLGEVRYDLPSGEHKRVRWWTMSVEHDDGFRPGSEIDALRWVPLVAVDGVLTWSTDREVVARFRSTLPR